MVYYNDNNDYCCDWLESLIAEGMIPWGIVDRRPIQKVKPDEISGYTQVHLFAGIGGWPLALRLAGWPDSEKVWTGSCPCQPFSIIGKGKGRKDKRHLWPHMLRLIRPLKPPTVFGEQVARKAGILWFNKVRSDLEASTYEVGAASLCALPFGAAHERQRLYFVAHADQPRLPTWRIRDEIKKNALQFKTRFGSVQFFGNDVPTYEWKNQPCLGRGIYDVPRRVGAIQAYGNSIIPAVAKEFITAYLETLH